MIQVTITGRLTKDSEIRSTQSGSVLGFSVASNKKVKGEETVTFVDCSMWGKRAEALVPHLTKGKLVCVVGEFGTREHNGKTYLTCRVSELDLMGGGNRGGQHRHTQADDSPQSAYGGGDAGPSDDDIPF